MSDSQDESEWLVKMANQLRPYITPTDPAIYSTVYPDNPNPNIVEVVGLMTELYQLFIEMRYLPEEEIEYAPHTKKPIDTKKAALFGLSKDVVDLMQMMPYIKDSTNVNWNFGSDAGEFLFGGEFGDHPGSKDFDWWLNVVDPFYAAQDITLVNPAEGWVDEGVEYGLYVRPWYVALNQMGNHGTVLFLDTKDFTISTPDQNDGDPKGDPKDAAEYLRDIINRFRTLKYIPGGLYGEIGYDGEDYTNFKQMYISAGWPDSFDGENFDRLRMEKEETDDSRYDSEESL